MERIWSIAEQVVECQATKFRFEFVSVPTDQSDTDVRLKVWNEARDRWVELRFDRNGYFVTSQVEHQLNADPAVHDQPSVEPHVEAALNEALNADPPAPLSAALAELPVEPASPGLVQPVQF